MSRRLEVELTSKRDDGSYTWRAAGAKQPKGELDGALLYEGAAVGDVVRVDAEFAVDGVFISAVLPPKSKKPMAQTLEMLGSGSDEGGVTTQLVSKRDRGRDRGRDGRRGRDGDSRGGRGRDRGRDGRDGRRGRNGDNRGAGRDEGRNSRGRGRSGDDRSRGRKRSDNRDRPTANRGPAKPKPKRLRARHVYRDAALKDLPEIQQPLARVVLRDGISGLRSVVEKQNVEAKAAGQVEIPPKVLEAVGENLLPRLRSAEWRDNAEAALAGIDVVDVRDIRKIVVAAENGAKDDESRALAEQLKNGLSARVEAEHRSWLGELDTLLREGRTVRALRLSSRPPKAGSPLPGDLASRLVEAAGQSMTEETSADRWATVLDAVAFSPVRQRVNPVGLPQQQTDELRATVKKLSKRVPHIAALFEAPAAPAPAVPAGAIPPPPTT